MPMPCDWYSLARRRTRGRFVDPGAIVGRAGGGGRLGRVVPPLGRRELGIDLFFLQRIVHAGQHLVFHTEPVEGVDVVALCKHGLQVLDLELRAAGQDRGGAEVAQVGAHGGRTCRVRREDPGARVRRSLAQADRARALVTLVVAHAELGLDQPAVVKAALVRQGAVAGAALIGVAGHAVVIARVQRQHAGVGDRRAGGGAGSRAGHS
jgi:hypothetical protein